jgi:tetratricopeptide (TPR) repeat protein
VASELDIAKDTWPFFFVITVISSLFTAIQLNPSYIRAILRRAELYEKTDKLDEALEDYKSILEKDPSVYQAREACMVKPNFFVHLAVPLCVYVYVCVLIASHQGTSHVG